MLQHLHEQVGHPVVDGPLAQDGSLLLAIEGGGVIFVFHNKARGVVGLENLFGLPLVKLFQFFHIHRPFLWIHLQRACAPALSYPI